MLVASAFEMISEANGLSFRDVFEANLLNIRAKNVGELKLLRTFFEDNRLSIRDDF